MPKTNGELRIHIRHDDEGDAHGLFVHGFKPGSRAERQGIIRVGDEIAMVDGVNVEGGFLDDIVAVIRQHTGDSVPMRLRRRGGGGGGGDLTGEPQARAAMTSAPSTPFAGPGPASLFASPRGDGSSVADPFVNSAQNYRLVHLHVLVWELRDVRYGG